jgi:acyl-coenzyme A synthetase/AMP-(fatty) acid ligase
MNSARPCYSPDLTHLLARPFDAAETFIDGGVTFGEVYGMATWLQTRLGKTEKRETICLATENRALIAAAILASLAGGPIVLLPYSFSAQALAGLNQATGCSLALVDSNQAPPPEMEVISPPGGAKADYTLLTDLRPEQELLRLYTGGSTGTPQLWSKTGTNLLGEALFLADHFTVTPQDRIVATISPAHIYGLLYSVLLPLVSGAAVVPSMPSFPEEIVRTVREHEATIFVSVPPHYRVLRGKGALSPSLRLAFSSAGMLDLSDNTEFCRCNPSGIVEVYGSTETGGIALRNRSRGETGFTPYATINWQIDNAQLLIRSPYLSPSLKLSQEGFFRTGDRVEADGTQGFQLKGRSDSVTKVGGKRVDLEEIKTAIKDMPDVSDCLVLALPDTSGRGHRIVALVETLGLEVDRIREALTSRFEPYALPRAVKIIERLPVKDNGKIDREAVLRLFAA